MTELIAGRYREIEEVGRGAQGRVVHARDEVGNTDVALKFSSAGPRELAVLRTIGDGPNLPRLLDSFVVHEEHVVVQEWIEGLSLEHILAVEGPFDLTRALSVAADVAAALEHLHARGLVHLDVKPANIIVTPDRAVLVDFGIAADRSGHRARFGTDGYRAPEVVTDQTPTARADVFGLAATVASMLSGDAPQPGAKPEWPGVPAGSADHVRRALRSALSVDPASRSSSAEAFVQSLRATGGGSLPPISQVPVAREAEASAIGDALKSRQIVTLAGAVGSGKTTLATWVANERSAQFPNGVWFVDLGDESSSPMESVARVMRAPDPIAALADSATLLVLDGAEKIAGSAADLVAEITLAGPDVRVLVTSIDELGCQGEHVITLEPLEVPGNDVSPETLARIGSVRALLDRARALSIPVSLDRNYARAIAALCKATAGLPVALNMAASMLADGQPTDEFVQELLSGSGERETGLEGILGASLATLSDHDRVVLARLSAFKGGFTRHAAVAVCGDEVITDVDGALVRLLRRALIYRDDRADGRYALQSIAAGTAEDLAGDDQTAARRHVTWVAEVASILDFVSLAGSAAVTDETTLAIAADAHLELANIRRAIERGLAFEMYEELVAICAGCSPLVWELGRSREFTGFFTQIVAHPDAQHAPRFAIALAGAGKIATGAGDDAEGERLVRMALDRSRAAGDQEGIVAALNTLALRAYVRGELAEARALIEECLEAAMILGSPNRVGSVTSNLIIVMNAQEDFVAARDVFDRTTFEGFSDEQVAAIEAAAAEALWVTGDRERARTIAERASVGARAIGGITLSTALVTLGFMLLADGLLRDAAAVLEELAGTPETRGHPHLDAYMLDLAASLATALGHFGDGRALVASARSRWAESGTDVADVYRGGGRVEHVVVERRGRVLEGSAEAESPSDDLEAMITRIVRLGRAHRV